jgi:hypothetical protein
VTSGFASSLPSGERHNAAAITSPATLAQRDSFAILEIVDGDVL